LPAEEERENFGLFSKELGANGEGAKKVSDWRHQEGKKKEKATTPASL